MHKFYLISCLSILILCGCSKDPLSKDPLNFKNADQVNVEIKDSVFPDFSLAGYKKNEEPIPVVPEEITITPGNSNDRTTIQHAIDSLSHLSLDGGFRGAIVLKQGEYFVDSTLTINKSGIVLRGEGQGENGTILYSTSHAEGWASSDPISSTSLAYKMQDFSLIQLSGDSQKSYKDNSQNITYDVTVGDTEIPVEDASSFQPGDKVEITKTVNQDWLNKIDMEQYDWTTKDFQIRHHSTILKIDSKKNILILEDPAVDNFFLDEGGGTVEGVTYPKRIENTGIENMRLIANTDGPIPEHHTWTAIKLYGVSNSWVRNITALHFSYSAVFVSGDSNYNTIQDCAMLEPVSKKTYPRRYHFYISQGKGNLFQRLYSEEGRHDFVTGNKTEGPNVFLDALALHSLNHSGPHVHWASGTLFDNISGNSLQARNAGSIGGGHGWRGVQTLYWNSHASKNFIIENPPNAVNWCIGCTGSDLKGNGYWANKGQYVSPRSLFIYQLDKRLGVSKANQIICPLQRGKKNIWDKLNNWAGSEDALVKLSP